ncbi:MAG: glycosyltransferase family 4 protein [Alphaproteobacteria bacterium]|nr:glycosyltransferase family 4 protein [Alphaproteobacteria bacterium]
MILIVTQTFAPVKGGMQAYMTGLAEELARTGHETVVFADGKNNGYVPRHPYEVRRFTGWRPLRRLKKRMAIGSVSAQRKIEGIFCDSWKSVEAIPSHISAPIVVLGHGGDCPVSPTSRKKRRIASALRRSTCVLANSHCTANRFRLYLSEGDERMKIVHPPIHPLPNPTPRAQEALKRLIGNRFPVISTLSRLEPAKGIDRVIEALPAVVAKHPTAVFLIGGAGADEPRLRALIKQTSMSAHVEFLGGLEPESPEKSALFCNSDVFAMPVRREGNSVEGFGISYIEAGFFGIPSLGGRGTGAEDAVIDGKTGLLCNGSDVADVTEKLLHLLDDEPFRCACAQAAKARADSLLWSHSLPLFLEALGPTPLRTNTGAIECP